MSNNVTHLAVIDNREVKLVTTTDWQVTAAIDISSLHLDKKSVRNVLATPSGTHIIISCDTVVHVINVQTHVKTSVQTTAQFMATEDNEIYSSTQTGNDKIIHRVKVEDNQLVHNYVSTLRGETNTSTAVSSKDYIIAYQQTADYIHVYSLSTGQYIFKIPGHYATIHGDYVYGGYFTEYLSFFVVKYHIPTKRQQETVSIESIAAVDDDIMITKNLPQKIKISYKKKEFTIEGEYMCHNKANVVVKENLTVHVWSAETVTKIATVCEGDYAVFL